ncbi:MAG TPA: CDP-alcohol phosphatidyltransferase family protein [Rhizomicrobium sp.]
MSVRKPARANESLSHAFEKPVLIWLAGKLPEWVTPDHLTVFGLLGAALTFASCLASSDNLQYLWLAAGGIVVNWFGDSLDGTLARVRRQERDGYGFFIDHSTDLLSQLLIGIGLGLTPFVRFDAACLALIAYLVLVAYMLIRERAFGAMQISFGVLGPTEVRVAIIGLFAWMFYGRPGALTILHAHFSTIDLIVLVASAGVFVTLPVAIFMEARRAAGVQDVRPPRRTEQEEFGTMVRTAPVALNRDDNAYRRRGAWRG